MSWLVSWFALTLSFALCAKFLKGFKVEGGVGTLLGLAGLYGLMLFAFDNWIVRGILGIFSLGVLWIPWVGSLIMGTLLLVITDKMSKRLTIDGFDAAFSAVLITVVTRFAADKIFALLAG
ncbi:MAG: phage holin family protein [Myxococcota bacterium]